MVRRLQLGDALKYGLLPAVPRFKHGDVNHMVLPTCWARSNGKEWPTIGQGLAQDAKVLADLIAFIRPQNALWIMGVPADAIRHVEYNTRAAVCAGEELRAPRFVVDVVVDRIAANLGLKNFAAKHSAF